MRYLRDLSGIQTPQVTTFPINTATNIAKNVYSTINSATGHINAITNAATVAVIGVTASSHNGADATLSPWENASTVPIYSSPTAVFAAPAPTITAVATSNAAVVNATGTLGDYADNDFIGGYLELKTLDATNGTTTDPVGTKHIITDSANTTKLLTVAFTNGAATGDIFYIYPPIGLNVEMLSGTTPSVLVDTASPVKVVGWDFDKKEVHLMATFHTYGNDVD
jgi:hypothetical protein